MGPPCDQLSATTGTVAGSAGGRHSWTRRFCCARRQLPRSHGSPVDPCGDHHPRPEAATATRRGLGGPASFVRRQTAAGGVMFTGRCCRGRHADTSISETRGRSCRGTAGSGRAGVATHSRTGLVTFDHGVVDVNAHVSGLRVGATSSTRNRVWGRSVDVMGVTPVTHPTGDPVRASVGGGREVAVAVGPPVPA
jgi:hypothetical protein